MKKTYLIRTLFVCLAAMPLCAGVILPDKADYLFSGNTSLTDETFNRPVVNGNGPPNTLSTDGDDVGYDALSFQVTTQGTYNLEVTPVRFGFYSYLFLYQTAFDPTNPLTDVLQGESNSDTTSGFSVTLLPDTTYIAVITGFSDFDEGAYSAEITEITPEPSTFIPLAAIAVFLMIGRLRKMARPAKNC